MTTTTSNPPLDLIRAHRQIKGVSAVLLPFDSSGQIDWTGLTGLVERTARSGLTPAVNMDTGHVNILSHQQKGEVLNRTRAILGDQPFFAGAYIVDSRGAEFSLDAYGTAIEQVQAVGAMPVIFQSFGLTNQRDQAIVESYHQISKLCDQFVAFELGEMFAPQGRIYSLDVFSQILQIKNCLAAKHSSLSRCLEWDRIRYRNEHRPEFQIYTGNDLAIDMVMYGSDYLLGLSTFAPDYFALRDKYWRTGDPRFYELNDTLQYLGNLAFRDPVPAYKQTAAMFLKLRGWIESDFSQGDQRRPASDLDLLVPILDRLSRYEDEST